MITKNIEALIQMQASHTLVRVIIPDTLDQLQSVVVGFDAYAEEMLLGGIYPQPSAENDALLKRKDFWIQNNFEGQFINVLVSYQNQIPNSDLVLVKIKDTNITDTRRWSPRVGFAPHKGPSTVISSRFGSWYDGYVKNISHHGALIEVFGQDLKSEWFGSNNVNVSIQFHEDFKISSAARVRQISCRRKPCFHSAVRIQFAPLPSETQNMLNQFVDQTRSQYLAA